MPRELNVLANDQLVGQLREQDDLWEFEYSAEWHTNPSAFDLSPELSRRVAMHRDGGTRRPVQWYFDNLLPEDGLRTILSGEARIDQEDAFGLLAHFGRESAGSLTLLTPGEAINQDRERRLLTKQVLSERIDRLPRIPINRDAPKRMSVAGAQHKLLVILEGNDLYEPIGETPSTHILKPNHPEAAYTGSVVNEYFTMRLARQMRLRVPDVHRLWVPQPVFLIDRFDRFQVDGLPNYRRRHIIDACQLLNKSRLFKYIAASVETLNLIIDRCRTKAAARQEIFRWLVFNALVGNGDNHLKNLSFIVQPNGIEIAPAYDLLSTAVYDTRAVAGDEARWPNTNLALPIGGATTFGTVRRANLVAAGRTLKVPLHTITRELDWMFEGLRGAADALIATIEEEAAEQIPQCPDPEAARAHLPGEMRLLRSIRNIVIEDMLRQMA